MVMMKWHVKELEKFTLCYIVPLGKKETKDKGVVNY